MDFLRSCREKASTNTPQGEFPLEVAISKQNFTFIEIVFVKNSPIPQSLKVFCELSKRILQTSSQGSLLSSESKCALTKKKNVKEGSGWILRVGMLAYYALRFWVQTPALQDK